MANIASGNGLLPESTKTHPAPLVTNHQWGLVELIWGQYNKLSKISSLDISLKLLLQDYSQISWWSSQVIVSICSIARISMKSYILSIGYCTSTSCSATRTDTSKADVTLGRWCSLGDNTVWKCGSIYHICPPLIQQLTLIQLGHFLGVFIILFTASVIC